MQSSTRTSSRLTAVVILAIVVSSAAWLPLLLGSAPVPDAAKTGFQSINAKSMESLLRFIASDELEGRDTGSRGLKVAARFLQVQYELAGLKPAPGQHSMLQEFSVIESVISDKSELRIVGPGAPDEHFAMYRDFVVFSQHSESAKLDLPLVFAGYGLKNENGPGDYEGLDVKGKFALVLDGSPGLEDLPDETPAKLMRKMRELRRQKAKLAAAAGAAGLVHVGLKTTPQTFDRYRRFLEIPRQQLTGTPPVIPQFFVSTALGDSLLRADQLTVAELHQEVSQSTTSQHRPLRSRLALSLDVSSETKWTQNVVAYLEGGDPNLKNEVVVFGAHYDHVGKRDNGDIYNGADDDGSGTVAMLEIARAFAKNEVRPRRSLLFVSHAGEEKGLLGSRFYTDNPQIALEQTVAQLNIDMIGRNDPNSVYIIGSNFLSKELHAINKSANEIIGMNLDYTYNDLNDPNRFYYRSDHYNYAKHGVPIIFYFSGTHEDYHKPTDTVDKIDFAKMQKVTQLVYLTGWQVANLNHRLASDGLLLEKKSPIDQTEEL